MSARRFVDIVGLTADQDITRTAVALVRAGYAVIPIEPGGKHPLCTLSARDRVRADREADGRHACGAHHAIATPEVARRVFARLAKGYEGQRLNLAVVTGASGIVTVDADTRSEVEEFLAAWASAEDDPGYLTHTPTTSTPGMLEGETWKHKDGGHFHFLMPDGVDLNGHTPASLKMPGGWVIMTGASYVLVPPSVRPEGPYKAHGDVVDAPAFLVDALRQAGHERAQRRQAASTFTPSADVASWAAQTPWSQLLEAAGWTATGEVETRCGCPTWTRPGKERGKSAVAHEAACPDFANVEGHGPLVVWSTTALDDLGSVLTPGQKTLTKLSFLAATQHDGDLDAARLAAGIEVVDLTGWLDDATVTGVTEPDVTVSQERQNNPDGLTDPLDVKDVRTSVSSSMSTSGDGVLEALGESLSELGIPASRMTEAKQEYAKLALRRAASKALERVERRQTQGPLGGWVGITDDEVEAILGGADEPGPTIMPRTDDVPILYAGRTNVIVGRRGAGKTWLAIKAAADVLTAGGRVLYLDMEDRSSAWRARFKDLGVDIDEAIRERRAVWKKPPDVPEDISAVVEWAGGFDLVVVDVLNRLITRLGGTPDNGNAEVLWLYDNLFDPLAQGHDVCVLLLDHPNKRGQRGDITSLDDLTPGGGVMRMNNASGVVIGMWPRKPFTRADPAGHVTLYCLKDRSGRFEEGQPVGELRGGIGIAEDSSTLTFELRIDPPDDPEAGDPLAEELEKVKRRVLRLLTTAPMTKGTLRPHITQRLRGWLDVALDDLVEAGDIVLGPGEKYSVTESDG